jgi:N-methylhydantoinase A
MFAELQTRGDDGHSRHESVRELSLDMRYSGQEYTLAIPVELDDQGQIASTSTAIAERFTAEYERAFAHSLDGEVEIVNLRATVRTALPRRATESRPTGSGRSIEDAPIHRAHSFRDGERIPFKILDRHDLPVGEQIASPAIVLEPTTTTYVDTGFRISVDDASGCMILTDDDAAA